MELTVENSGADPLLRVEGDLDADSAYRVYEGVAALVEDGTPRRVLIDLADVPFIDSVGLGMLIRSEEEARRSGAALVLQSPSPAVRRLLALTATDRHFEIT